MKLEDKVATVSGGSGLLFRRRQVWWPTVWGALLLVSILLAALMLLGWSAYPLLAPQQPARGPNGQGASTLIVEGWLGRGELDQAVEAFRRRHYERVVTTGGPIDGGFEPSAWPDFAERAAAYLRTHGLEAVPVIAVPTPETPFERTWLSAVTLRGWAERERIPLEAIDVFTAGVHARRSWLVYRMAFGERVEVGVLAAQPDDHDPRRWWASSAGAKAVVGEALSLAWTHCCFWPPQAELPPR